MKNHVSLIGTLGADPELKNLEGGKKVATLRVATSAKWQRENGEKVEKTEWHNVVLWGRSAEIAEQYLKKGGKVGIEGRIEYREYTDKDGIKRKVTDIVGDEFFLLTPKA